MTRPEKDLISSRGGSKEKHLLLPADAFLSNKI
jgi:hypothetical protein